jgi:hypothetical protein
MPNSSEENIGEVPGTTKKLDAIRKAIALFEEKLENGDMKVTASEYIRLLELLQQIDGGDKPREIRIRWVDQNEMPESSTEE